MALFATDGKHRTPSWRNPPARVRRHPGRHTRRVAATTKRFPECSAPIQNLKYLAQTKLRNFMYSRVFLFILDVVDALFFRDLFPLSSGLQRMALQKIFSDRLSCEKDFLFMLFQMKKVSNC